MAEGRIRGREVERSANVNVGEEVVDGEGFEAM